MLRVISLGAGVQSTTMALMAAHGELTPTPDAAIFADTGAEPKPVYEHLKWLRSWGVLPFPVWVVSAGNIAEDLKRGMSTVGSQGRFAGAPFFIKRMKPNGVSYELSMGRRQCTRHYKVDTLANDPQSFAEAVEVDELVRQGGHMRKWRNELFVHRSLKPLAEVDFSADDEPDLFNNECEGLCGV